MGHINTYVRGTLSFTYRFWLNTYFISIATDVQVPELENIYKIVKI